MVSTKLLRLPTRGALGNGLRVVAGAVLASGGSLTVITRNKRIELRPERDGTTTVVSVKAVEFPVGTRIEISFGPALPCDDGTLGMGEDGRCQLAQTGTTYAGKTSPWWYDAPQFHELLYASGDTPVRELVAQLDGCSGGKAGEIVAAAGLGRAHLQGRHPRRRPRSCCGRARQRQAGERRSGSVRSARMLSDDCLRHSCGVAEFGAAEPYGRNPLRRRGVGRARMRARHEPVGLREPHADHRRDRGRPRQARHRRLRLRAFHTIAQAPKEAQFAIWLNIITPYMPITSATARHRT